MKIFHLQVREFREHDDPGVDQGVQLWQAGGREGGDRVCKVSRWQVHLQARPEPHVRVHDQLHLEAKEPSRKIYDEQRLGKLHYPLGKYS